jgi:hypothetical protein
MYGGQGIKGMVGVCPPNPVIAIGVKRQVAWVISIW